MIVSVVYPEQDPNTLEGLLMGDNIVYAEVALLWVKEQANIELGINIQRVFLEDTLKEDIW